MSASEETILVALMLGIGYVVGARDFGASWSTAALHAAGLALCYLGVSLVAAWLKRRRPPNESTTTTARPARRG